MASEAGGGGRGEDTPLQVRGGWGWLVELVTATLGALGMRLAL